MFQNTNSQDAMVQNGMPDSRLCLVIKIETKKEYPSSKRRWFLIITTSLLMAHWPGISLSFACLEKLHVREKMISLTHCSQRRKCDVNGTDHSVLWSNEHMHKKLRSVRDYYSWLVSDAQPRPRHRQDQERGWSCGSPLRNKDGS